MWSDKSWLLSGSDPAHQLGLWKEWKGYYNDMFAPGWTVASLWELLTPGRTENILLK